MVIRILLAQLPYALQEILADTLSSQPDMVVRRVGNHMEMLLAARETQADVVIIGMEDVQPPGVVSHLLDEDPSLKVILVDIDDQRGFLHELRPELRPIGQVTSPQLPSIIRTATRGREGA